jgi:transposase InsO family protein
VTTDSKHNLPVAPNLLDRNFNPEAPNQVWTSDITYLWTDEGWLYLALVLDLFNREVIGWSLKPRMTATSWKTNYRGKLRISRNHNTANNSSSHGYN